MFTQPVARDHVHGVSTSHELDRDLRGRDPTAHYRHVLFVGSGPGVEALREDVMDAGVIVYGPVGPSGLFARPQREDDAARAQRFGVGAVDADDHAIVLDSGVAGAAAHMEVCESEGRDDLIAVDVEEIERGAVVRPGEEACPIGFACLREALQRHRREGEVVGGG